MKRYRLGPLHGQGITVANNVHLHWVKFNRFQPWKLSYLTWRGLRAAGRMTSQELAEYYGMKRITDVTINKPISHVVNLDGLESLPGLKDFLTSTFYGEPSDNDERLPGSIYIAARDKEFGITCKEPTQGLVMRLQVPSFKLIIPTLEAVLTDYQRSKWETDPYARKPAKSPRKPKA